MRTIDKEKLKDILEKHLKYVISDGGGERADLSDADLSGADLSGADLRNANLEDILYDEKTASFALCCPEEGSFIGFKKCRDNLIVKLEIPAEAKRSSATTRKCRCSEAKVVEILTKTGEKTRKRKAVSLKYRDFIYKVGETVKAEDFYNDRWAECAAGIHFFITFDEAVKYKY